MEGTRSTLNFGEAKTMNEWQKQIKANPLPWLLEPDAENPGIRYFALTAE